MDFSGISKKSFIGKVLRFPLRFIPKNARLPILQGKAKGLWWIVGSSIHSCWLGSYECEQRKLLEKHIAEGSVFFDVGAHVGFYALLASRIVGPRGKVIAFEPLQRNIFYLKKHIEMNNIENVTIIEAAVSNHCGVGLFKEGISSGMGALHPEGDCTIKVISLDEAIDSKLVPVPDNIKIDVEGNELEALLGARSLLRDNHPNIFLETHSEDLHMKCRDLLESYGYEIQLTSKILEESDVRRWYVSHKSL